MVSVSNLLKKKGNQVWSIPSTKTIQDALGLLAEKDIGALVVMKNGEICGIFSERDFARWIADKGSCSLSTAVSKLMTENVLTVSPQDSVNDCMKIMTEHHVRHLPVVDKDKLVGLVSIGDVVKSIISHQKTFIQQLEDYISGRW